jgi:GcvH upstream region-like protein
MLQFFRKYQRFFLGFVATIVILSFSFFGTFSSFVNTPEVKDQVIGKAIDGSNMSRREVELLAHFLATSSQDISVLGPGKMPNLLNDDVVRKDFLATGVGAAIARHFFEELKPELEERLQKVKNFSFYAHPQAPFISAQEVWKQFAPQAFQTISLLKEQCPTADLRFFSLLTRLSIEQQHLPSEMVRKILTFQQSQYDWLTPDDALYFTNLNPFGFESLDDWFGQRYLQLIAQFIVNASKIAENKGYKVSTDEVRADLLQNVHTALTAMSPQSKPTLKDAQLILARQMQSMGLEESSAVKLWKKVMLFRKLSSDIGNFTLIDSLPFEAMNRYGSETALVNHYELPDALCFRDFRKLLKFQCYLEATTDLPRTSLSLPKSFLPVSEVEKKHPEFVRRPCKLKWKEVKKDALAQRVTLKETWAWETEESNWQFLQNHFSYLGKEDKKTAAGRLEFLDRLDPKERIKIDRFSRLKILEAHPEWVEEAFEKAAFLEDAQGIRLKEGHASFARSQNPAELIEKLTKTPSFAFSDEEGYYRISVEDMSKENVLISFEEANSDGTLDEILNKKLTEAYTEVRKKNPAAFELTPGVWKPLNEVKDQVGAHLYSSLLKAIEEDCKKAGCVLENKEGFQPLEFYSTHRFHHLMRECRTKMAHSKDEKALAVGPWMLKKRQHSLKRSEKTHFKKEELFSLPVGSWSSVISGSTGELNFFEVLEINQDTAMSQGEKERAKHALGEEASRKFMVQLLEEMISKKAIGMQISKEI